MKKLLACLLSIVLLVGVLTSFGCSSAFDGNYEEVDKNTVVAYAEQFETTDSTSIDFAKGVQMKLEFKGEAGGISSIPGAPVGNVSFDINFDSKVATQNEELLVSSKMQMKVSAAGQSQNGNAEVWYKDGYGYIKVNSAGQEIKYKQAMEFNEALFGGGLAGDLGGGLDGDIESDSFSEIFKMYDLNVLLANIDELDENAKFYMETTEDGTKIKIEAQTVIEGEPSKMLIVLVFDAQKVLTACKIETSLTMNYDGMSMNADIKLTIEEFEGQINLPSDLSNYSTGF